MDRSKLKRISFPMKKWGPALSFVLQASLEQILSERVRIIFRPCGACQSFFFSQIVQQFNPKHSTYAKKIGTLITNGARLYPWSLVSWSKFSFFEAIRSILVSQLLCNEKRSEYVAKRFLPEKHGEHVPNTSQNAFSPRNMENTVRTCN